VCLEYSVRAELKCGLGVEGAGVVFEAEDMRVRWTFSVEGGRWGRGGGYLGVSGLFLLYLHTPRVAFLVISPHSSCPCPSPIREATLCLQAKFIRICHTADCTIALAQRGRLGAIRFSSHSAALY